MFDVAMRWARAQTGRKRSRCCCGRPSCRRFPLTTSRRLSGRSLGGRLRYGGRLRHRGLSPPVMKSPSETPLRWLGGLAGASSSLPQEQPPPPYYSQRGSGAAGTSESSLPTMVRLVCSLVRQFHDDHYFAETLGFDCVDDSDYSKSSLKRNSRVVSANRVCGRLSPRPGPSRTCAISSKCSTTWLHARQGNHSTASTVADGTRKRSRSGPAGRCIGGA